MATCDACDAALDPERDKAGGRYRDRCLPCIREAVDAVPHVHACEERDCPVCRDHRRDDATQVPSDPEERSQSAIGTW